MTITIHGAILYIAATVYVIDLFAVKSLKAGKEATMTVVGEIVAHFGTVLTILPYLYIILTSRLAPTQNDLFDRDVIIQPDAPIRRKEIGKTDR